MLASMTSKPDGTKKDCEPARTPALQALLSRRSAIVLGGLAVGTMAFGTTGSASATGTPRSDTTQFRTDDSQITMDSN
jgi:anti-sigma factor RsiW